MLLRTLAVVVAAVAALPPAHAHEVRPGYLALEQTGEETYNVFWKVPASGNLKLAIHVGLPENCSTVFLGAGRQQRGGV